METYVHGSLDNGTSVDELLKPFAGKFSSDAPSFDYQAYKEEQYNKLADHVRRYVDMDRVYQILSAHD